MLKCYDAKMNRGFTLLEVVIAIFIFLVGVTGTLFLITRTVGQMNLFPSQLIASYLTQEGIEIIRNIRDTNYLEQATDAANPWNEGLTGCSTGTSCEADYTTGSVTDANPKDPALPLYGTGRFLKIDSNGVYSYSGTTDTKFKRKITIVPGADTLTVTVETTWTEKAKNYSHTAQEVLYNWK